MISGMALGWDQALAAAAIALDIPLFAAIPFEDQESRWPAPVQERYHRILDQATSIHLVTAGGYSAHKMQVRNSVPYGQPAGRSPACIQYARQVEKPVTNLWISWIRYK